MIIDSGVITGSLVVSGSYNQTGSAVINGNLTVTGILNATISGSATSASYAATASVAISASYATSASLAATALSAPYYLLTSSFDTFSGSASTRLTNLESFSSSLDATFATDAQLSASVAALSSSLAIPIANLESTASTLTNASASFASSIDSLQGVTGSYATTGSNTFNGSQTITGSLNVSAGVSGSFSGSFQGNGSGLTNVPASGIVGLQLNQIGSGSVTASIAPDLGFRVNTNSQITGSLIVSNGISGNLNGQVTGSFSGSLYNLQNITVNHIPYFSQSQILTDSAMFQVDNGLDQGFSIAINQNGVNSLNPEALFVYQSSTSSYNAISAKGNLNNYLQLNIQNENNGANASSDIVATANNGNETTNFIDMGINGANFAGPIGGANDAYIYSTGVHLHIGNATAGQYVGFFAGGDDVDANMKLLLDAGNLHELTGSLNASEGFTGSLQGNAATATSASYAATASFGANFTASNALINNTLTAQTLIVQTITSSVQYSSGSNVFGNLLTNTQQFTGSVTVTGSLAVNGSDVILTNQTSSMSVLSASYATTASYVANAQTASYVLNAQTASYVEVAQTASYVLNAQTASYVTLAQTASYVQTAQTASYVQTAQTASYVLNAVSASFASTASSVNTLNQTVLINGNLQVTGSTILTGSLGGTVFSANVDTMVFTGSLNITGSVRTTGSFSALGGITGSLLGTASTASYVNPLVQNVFITGALNVTGSSNQIGNNVLFGDNTITGSNSLLGNNTIRGNNTISGSLLVSGSETFIGALTLTGSFLVSGSTIQIGNNLLTGNTQLTGSIEVSGSQTFIGRNTITGSVNITGSTTQVGNNTLLGNTLLSGSLVISGSVAPGNLSASVNIYGDTALAGFLRFNPYNTNIDTSISASYIYVSGSTNDLYFSQNGEGYSNTTRLRWIEGNLYTGLLNGGLITSQSSTVYQVGSGSGIIVNLNASLYNNPYPTIQYVNWPNLSASIAPLSASYDQQYVGIDSNGQIYAQGVPFTDGQFDTLISVGFVLHQNNSTINGLGTQPEVAYGWKQRSDIFINAFGPLKLSGLNLLVSGSSTGSLVVTSGYAFLDGGNYRIDPNNPSYVNSPGTNTSKIYRYYQSGSDWVYNTNNGAGYGAIDPANYSNNGVLTAVPSPVGSNWTIQRVFYFPASVQAQPPIVVYYGNAVYGSEQEAVANIPFEPFVEAPNTQANAVYLGAMVVAGNANFTSAATYTIYPGGLFRQVGGSGGGGSTTTQTLAGLSDVSITGPTNLQPLAYSTTAGKWVNISSLSASIAGNATTATSASHAATSSWALDAINASTASYVVLAQTASYVLNAVSSSFASTASFVQNAQTASYVTLAQTASYVETAQTASYVALAQTASYVTLAQTASYVTTAQTASYVQNAQTASYVTLAQTASYVANAQTASYVLNAVSASYATTASYVANAQTASYVENAQTASYVLNAVSASFASSAALATLAQTALFASLATTASFALNAATSSVAINANSATSASRAAIAGFAETASFIANAQTASYVLNAVSASYALTASAANIFTANQITASNITVTGTVTAQTLNVQQVTSSIIYSSGSNQFGNLLTDRQQFTGSVTITGSLQVNGRTPLYTDQTASLTVLSASYAATASSATSTATIPFNVGLTSTYYGAVASSNVGSNNVFTLSTGSYTAAKFLYTVANGSSARSGEVFAVWNAGIATFTDVSTLDLGNTSNVSASVSIVSSQVQFNFQTSTSGWTIKSQGTLI